MKKDFNIKSQLEQVYESDKKHRARVYKTFNKQREDFPSEEEYNKYLEEVEDIIFK